MIAASRALGAVVAIGAALMLAAASSAPLRVHSPTDAMVRISFSARPERVENCRQLTPEELSELPQHMRQSVVCGGRAASYRLQVVRNGVSLEDSEVHGGGLRRDRQLYVMREFLVPSGSMTLEVHLTRMDSSSTDPGLKTTGDSLHEGDTAALDRNSREADERRRRMADEVPATLSLKEEVLLAPREVLLVTYDQEAKRLRIVRMP